MTSAGVSWPVSWSGWPDLNRRPLRPELAAPLGVWPSSQLAPCAAGRGRWRLYGDVAVLPCCTVRRISSSRRRGSDSFLLDRRTRSVLRVPHRTALNCNPNCNLQIRRSGHVVQSRPLWSVRWSDIPGLSAPGRRCLAAWQQVWQQSRRNRGSPRPSAFQAGHISSWDGSCECAALSLIAVACRWLLLSLLLSG